jgi:hypothetical protein
MSLLWNLFKRGHSSIGVVADGFRFVRSDIQGARKYNVPIQKRIKVWRHGFTAKSWIWLDLDNNDPSKYINNIHARRVIPYLNGEYGGIFADDIAFYKASKEFEIHLPNMHGIIQGGEYFPYEDNNEDESMLSIFDGSEAVIIKPICGNQGEGVRKIQTTERGYSINGVTKTSDEFQDLVTALNDYVVMEFISHHDYSATIFPDATNTIRFITAVDQKTQKAHILRATHRFGTPQSAPTDNWSGGGLCAPIRDDGTIGKAVNQHGQGSIQRIETHPATGAQITGVEIPQWEDACRLVRDVATHHNRAKYVGWDVVLTNDKPIVIEANSNPGINLPQIDRGLLENSTARRFFNNFL